MVKYVAFPFRDRNSIVSDSAKMSFTIEPSGSSSIGTDEGAMCGPASRTLGTGDDLIDTYELFDAWNGVQQIYHRLGKGRDGVWDYVEGADQSAFDKDGVIATIQWSNGEVETLTTRNEKQYFSSKPDKPFEVICISGPTYED